MVFRDPRDVVISEFKMRRDYYHQKVMDGVSLDDFILKRFEVSLGLSFRRSCVGAENGWRFRRKDGCSLGSRFILPPFCTRYV